MTTRVELEWKENPAEDLAGYKVIWTTYDPKDQPKVLMFHKGTHKLTLDLVLQRKKVYIFFVIAFDKAGNDSTPTILRAWYKE